MTLEPAQALSKLAGGHDLGRHEMEELFGLLMDGRISDPLKAALLVALAMKGETAEEIAGAAAAMRTRVVRVPSERQKIVDTCGTGGDGRGTFNISTAAALVAAAAGVPVAKHGNRSVSSRSGSADVLVALGVEVDLDAKRVGRALDEVGIGFLFAPRLHPAMRQVMPVRRELAMRTIFNVLGPLTNPAGARRQVMGVYSRDLVELMAAVLAKLGAEHALVVHGSDGLDEITTTGPTHVAEVKDGKVATWTLEPETLGIERVELARLTGGSPDTNADLMLRMLSGQDGPMADVTLLNAGAAIWVGDRAESLEKGLTLARQAWKSGAAAKKLEELRDFSRRVA